MEALPEPINLVLNQTTCVWIKEHGVSSIINAANQPALKCEGDIRESNSKVTTNNGENSNQQVQHEQTEAHAVKS